ncbi:MAG TPA: hypothetical protein VGM25_05110 [Caulobacteraceae bacterium]|jgi:hypothetical protein
MNTVLIAIAATALASTALAGAVSAAPAASDPWAGVPAAERPAAGTPDLSGVWAMPSPIRALKTSDGKDPPLLPAARAEYRKRLAALKANPKSDPVSNCWMQGVPRLVYAPYPVLIAQEKDRVNLVYETNHTFRIVDLRRPLPKKGPDLDPQWLGYSVGHFEGKTLVVDSVGFNDKTWLDYSGLPHGEKLEVQERYTLEGPGRIAGVVTITDPDTFSRPWTTAFTLVKKPGYELKENVCVRDHRM